MKSSHCPLRRDGLFLPIFESTVRTSRRNWSVIHIVRKHMLHLHIAFSTVTVTLQETKHRVTNFSCKSMSECGSTKPDWVLHFKVRNVKHLTTYTTIFATDDLGGLLQNGTSFIFWKVFAMDDVMHVRFWWRYCCETDCSFSPPLLTKQRLASFLSEKLCQNGDWQKGNLTGNVVIRHEVYRMPLSGWLLAKTRFHQSTPTIMTGMRRMNWSE